MVMMQQCVDYQVMPAVWQWPDGVPAFGPAGMRQRPDQTLARGGS